PCNTSLQLYWLKQYQPARLAAARYLFFAKDWIRFRLTGVAAPCNTSLQLYWLKQYQPARLAAARYLFFAKDWIR
ncbi:hypothetical protein CKJ90_32220, partial [Klebsiella pneumoniae]